MTNVPLEPEVTKPEDLTLASFWVGGNVVTTRNLRSPLPRLVNIMAADWAKAIGENIKGGDSVMFALRTDENGEPTTDYDYAGVVA